MLVAGALITAAGGYLAAIARNRTDASIANQSAKDSEHERLQSAYLLTTGRLEAYYKDELERARAEEVRLRAENERLWREFREAVDAGATLKSLHEEEVESK